MVQKENKEELTEITAPLDDSLPIEPVMKRMNELEVLPSTKIAYNKITKTKTRTNVAMISLECEQEANYLMSSIEKIKGVKDIQSELLYKGEEEIEVPPLPIMEMRVVDPKTNTADKVVYGLEASMTNHRVIFLDVDITSTPRVIEKIAAGGTLLGSKKNIEISHQVTSSFTYIPVSYPDILGLTCDIQNGFITQFNLSDQRLWLFSLLPIALAVILALVSHWLYIFIALLGIPFFLISRPIKQSLPNLRTQVKVLKLAVINPENKKLSVFELYIPHIYSLEALMLWIKELQFRSPSLQHVSEMNKNLNINIG